MNKKVDARANLLFCLINLFSCCFDVLVAVAVAIAKTPYCVTGHALYEV